MRSGLPGVLCVHRCSPQCKCRVVSWAEHQCEYAHATPCSQAIGSDLTPEEEEELFAAVRHSWLGLYGASCQLAWALRGQRPSGLPCRHT